MQKLTLGIIGYGNMGSAIAHGILASTKLHSILNVGAHDIQDARRSKLEEAGGRWWASADSLAADCDLVLLAVKPYQVQKLLKGIRPFMTQEKTLLSIAAGQPLSVLRTGLQGVCAAVQIMPNTPALVGEGVFGLCLEDPALPQERAELVRQIFSELGQVFVLPEAMMNALMAVTGCGPAYVFSMMGAVIEAAVTLGFTREDATAMTAALFKGSAKMMETTGLHPAVLQAKVTSPKGSTIAGTNHLERCAVRGHIIDAVLAAFERGRKMEKE